MLQMQYGMDRSIVFNTDGHQTICNVFWKLSLTLHPYKVGNRTVDFGSLWPDEGDLEGLLLEAYRYAIALILS